MREPRSRSGREWRSAIRDCMAVIVSVVFLSPLPALGRTICDLATNGQVDDVRVMVEAGADTGEVCRGGRTPLDVAVENGNENVVRVLLAAGVPSKYANIEMLVYLAAARNRPQVIRALGEAGVSLVWRNTLDRTPIHIAAAKGHDHAVDALILLGVDANLRGAGGWTPLHEAARTGHVSTLRILAMHGGDPSVLDSEGRTAAKLAADAGHLDAVRFLAGE